MMRSTFVLLGLLACANPPPPDAPRGPVVVESRATPQCAQCTNDDSCTVLLAGCAFDASNTQDQCVNDTGAAVVERDTRIDCEVRAGDSLRGSTLACRDHRCVLLKPQYAAGELPRHVNLLERR